MADPMMSDKDKSDNDPDGSKQRFNVTRNKVIQPLSTLGDTGGTTAEDEKSAAKTEDAAKAAEDKPVTVVKDKEAAAGADVAGTSDEASTQKVEVKPEDSAEGDEGHEKIEVRRVEKKPDIQEETKDSVPGDAPELQPAGEDAANTETTEEETPGSEDEQPEEEEETEESGADDQASKEIEEQAAEETATVNAVASKARDRGAESKKAEEERKKQENIQHLIESKRFFLPIKTSKKHRRSRTVALFVLLMVLAAGGFAAANGYLDLSDLKLPGGYSRDSSDEEPNIFPVQPEHEQPAAEEQAEDVAAVTKARDTERKSDIDSIVSSLEGFFVENDRYPTLGQLNNPQWRSENIPDLDKESLLDPEGLDYVLTESASPNTYAYITMPEKCDNVEINCVAYELTATLSDGQKYTKTKE